MSVSLVRVLMSRIPVCLNRLPLKTVVSRKDASEFEKAKVNFMRSCWELAKLKKSVIRLVFWQSQIMKPSSLYLRKVLMRLLCGKEESVLLRSSNILISAISGDGMAPILVPVTWVYGFPAKVKWLLLRRMSSSCRM